MLSIAISVAAIATSSAISELRRELPPCSTAGATASSRSPTARLLLPPAVRVAHAELCRRLPHEVDFDEHRGLVADDPAVVARLDGDDLRRGELERRAVAVPDADAAAGDEADVRVHAQVGAHRVLHVRRPAEAGLVD